MRKARIIQEGATYHVTGKTNRGEFILYSDEVKDLFLSVIREAKNKYDFKLINFCIMSNHFHLLIEPGRGTNLSKLMQWILSVFAIRFNKIYKLIGHVWYDRFKSVIVRTFQHYVNAFHYISDNPVKAGICKNAGDYYYSGLYELKRQIRRVISPPDDWIKLIIRF